MKTSYYTFNDSSVFMVTANPLAHKTDKSGGDFSLAEQIKLVFCHKQCWNDEHLQHCQAEEWFSSFDKPCKEFKSVWLFLDQHRLRLATMNQSSDLFALRRLAIKIWAFFHHLARILSEKLFLTSKRALQMTPKVIVSSMLMDRRKKKQN